MEWRSSVQISAWLSERADLDRIQFASSLSTLLRTAFRKAGYKIHPGWEEWVTLSSAGTDCLALDRRFTNAPDVKLAFFAKFFHHDLLVDPDRSDLESIRAQLAVEAQDLDLRWPFSFGRNLYDKFNDEFTGQDRTDHLLLEETEALLDGTPQGVYQVGRIVTGTLGLLESGENRFYPPKLSVPLWHCSDTGCTAFHRVSLARRVDPVLDILSGTLLRTQGPPSEWAIPLKRLGLKQLGSRYYDLPAFLGDALVATERSALLAAALGSSAGPELRNRLGAQSRLGAKGGEGSAGQVLGRITAEEQLQLLLTLPDSQLVALLDEGVQKRRIAVPLGEIRAAKQAPPTRSNLDRSCQMSARGLRSRPRDPLVRFSAVVYRAYQDASLGPDLAWRLRRYSSASLADSLANMVIDLGPAATIRQLIVGTRAVAEAVARDLGMGPIDPMDEDALVETMAWKVGFDLPRYDDAYPRFRGRVEAPNDACVRIGEPRSEDDREELRKAGVNLFVSAEHFVAELVSFVTWVFSNDHLVSTRFVYDSAAATEGVAGVIGAQAQLGDQVVTWNRSGENALGTLLAYADKCLAWLETLRSRDRGAVLRPERELPHYTLDADRIFPFRHTQAWADCDPRAFGQVVEDFGRVVEHLRAADLAFVRNGLDHKRDGDRFPPSEKIRSCTSRLGAALDLAEERRLIPKAFWLSRVSTQHSKVVEYDLRDYRGRSVVLRGPSVLSGLQIPRFGAPVIVAPDELLGHANWQILFSFRERSAFADYWKGYPRRRRIPSGEGSSGVGDPVAERPADTSATDADP